MQCCQLDFQWIRHTSVVSFFPVCVNLNHTGNAGSTTRRGCIERRRMAVQGDVEERNPIA